MQSQWVDHSEFLIVWIRLGPIRVREALGKPVKLGEKSGKNSKKKKLAETADGKEKSAL